jgi:hypothetical protein
VDDTVDIRVRGEDLVQFPFICDVDFVELWSLAAEQLNAVEGDFGGIVEGIDDYDFVSMFEKCQTRE